MNECALQAVIDFEEPPKKTIARLVYYIAHSPKRMAPEPLPRGL
jgi:hypothetical protein